MDNVTIRDVARLAGVSHQTVSRVINDSPKVAPETKLKVLKTAEELNYHPSVAARSLSSGRANTIGLFVPISIERLSSIPIFGEGIEGVANVATEYGLGLQLFMGKKWADENACCKLFRERRVDGLIVIKPKVRDRYIEALKRENYPFVVIGRPSEEAGVAYVDNDNVKLAFDGVTHLLKLGHRRIGFINESRELTESIDRLEGYAKAFRDYGLDVDDQLIREGDFSLASGFKEAQELLSLRPRPTAIFAINDMVAVGAMRAVRRAGLRVPEDVAVVGANDTHVAVCTEPLLTTVRIHAYKAGVLATRMLVRIIKGKPLTRPHVLLPTEMVIRDSCGARLGSGNSGQIKEVG